MELAIPKGWFDNLSPTLKAGWETYQKRKAEGKLELWEKAKLGVLPNKIYLPVETNDDTK